MDRILIAGAGALGSFFAAVLSRAGFELTLLAREPRLSLIRSKGILFEHDGVRSRHAVRAHDELAMTPAPDLVLLCTKTIDLPAMLDKLAPLAKIDCVFVTVQNGVEAHDLVAARFPEAPVIAARVHGFFELADGVVRHVGVKPSLVYGHAAGPSQGHADRFSVVLTAAGIANRHSDTIMCDLWAKMLLASSIGAVGAALGVPAGKLCEHQTGLELLTGVMREVHTLALRKGIGLPDDCVERTLEFVAGFPPAASSSMQRDLECGEPSEYDSLAEAIIRMAAHSGIDVPVHHRIDAMIRKRGLLPAI
ncbi:MAG: 2-dehydropantoate 2-reductase [Novosphingobium sp.]|nr:2-dehydropantoate 2-reductase [Novosphingobium sp.]